ncbi:MAG: 3',5'-cyclic-nucleotide phosphodiesterase [Mariprofundaceae bacterium]|nr:3',5'-cyclic-nucleotide phosphodiesterase [Mariprofundaceae bacterium]
MKIRVLGCYGGQLLGFHLSSFLINDSILLDAGAPTICLTLEEQRHIEHVFVSHTHLDHIQDIAFLSDNRSLKRLSGQAKSRTITIHSVQENLDILSKHFLNNLVWPDFTIIPSPEDPILKLQAIENYQPTVIDGLSITPIPMNHPVPCTGFLLDQDGKQFIYSADTGVSDAIWKVANAQPNLCGLIIDCSFPNDYEFLANISGHMTPKQMAQDLKKLKKLGKIPIYLFHMKPETLAIMSKEIDEENIPHLRMLTQVDEFLL